MAKSDLELLDQYALHHSEEAFARLVRRRLDLVYSAALRQVNSPQLAEEVAQSVFADLARNALKLKPGTLLTAWLYQVTRRTAIDVVRKESSRQARERMAAEMTPMKADSTEWGQLRPLLDEAMEALEEADRNVLLLRYFENRSLREVGQTLGTTEDTAQKRVSRALERLRGLLAKRGLAIGAGSLAALLSANTLQAAPAGLHLSISAAAAICGGAIHSTAASVGTIKAIAMTTTHKTLITVALAAAAGTGAYEAHRASDLQRQLQAQQAQQEPLAEEARQLRQRLEDASHRLAHLQEDNVQLNRELAELPKLRSEVSTLRAGRGRGAQSPAGASASGDAFDGAIKAWYGHVEQLQQCLAQNPQAAIPELKFLTAQDWLSATEGRNFNKEYEYHQAMSRLRAAGETHFIDSYLRPALEKYVAAHDGQFPADLSQLQAFFSSPVDEAILQRYEIVPHNKFPKVDWGGDWLVTQKAAVDSDYDQRLFVGAKGGWGRIGWAATEGR